jgi:rSAM/selenodomain-associated transferase 2
VDAPQTPRFAWWKRLLILAVTIAAVASIYRRLDLAAFVDTLQQTRLRWVLAAVCLYGVVLFGAVGRWHLAMRLTDSVVHFTASVRSVLIGHFFSIALFTASVGDVAKSLLYARWYSFAFPVVFAGAKLDRVMGFVGLQLIGLVGLGWALGTGALADLPAPDVRRPPPSILVLAGLGLAGVAVVLGLNRAFRAGLRHFLDALIEGLSRLWRWPRVMAGGLFCGIVVQGGLSFLLALNLLAVTQTEIPWLHLLWLFPVIQFVSTLPITVGGLGLREAAAMILLGLYGVPPEEAAAAALLSFLVATAWAGVGGLVLWRESARLTEAQHQPPAEAISVVMPVLNEAAELPATLQRLQAIPEIREIIVVDGGSTDATRDIARSLGCRVLDSPPGRGRQMRFGAQHATGDVVMLVHADTWLPPHTGTAALNCLRDPLVVGGGFWKYFREYPHPILYGSRWRCGFRLVFGRWIAGDQALFVRREVLEHVGGVPELELMEEVRLCELLRRHGRIALAGEKISTSARRFAKFGTLRTLWLMNVLLWKYRRGTSPHELLKRYEQSA